MARITRFSHITEYEIELTAMLAAVNQYRRATADPRHPEGGAPLTRLSGEHLSAVKSAIEWKGKVVVTGEIANLRGAMLPPPVLPPGFGPSAQQFPKPPSP